MLFNWRACHSYHQCYATVSFGNERIHSVTAKMQQYQSRGETYSEAFNRVSYVNHMLNLRMQNLCFINQAIQSASLLRFPSFWSAFAFVTFSRASNWKIRCIRARYSKWIPHTPITERSHSGSGLPCIYRHNFLARNI